MSPTEQQQQMHHPLRQSQRHVANAAAEPNQPLGEQFQASNCFEQKQCQGAKRSCLIQLSVLSILISFFGVANIAVTVQHNGGISTVQFPPQDLPEGTNRNAWMPDAPEMLVLGETANIHNITCITYTQHPEFPNKTLQIPCVFGGEKERDPHVQPELQPFPRPYLEFIPDGQTEAGDEFSSGKELIGRGKYVVRWAQWNGEKFVTIKGEPSGHPLFPLLARETAKQEA